jgi:hypothetical protein
MDAVANNDLRVTLPRPGRTNCAAAVRREMSAIYKGMRTGLIEPSEGTRLIYALRQILDANAVEHEQKMHLRLTRQLQEIQQQSRVLPAIEASP